MTPPNDLKPCRDAFEKIMDNTYSFELAGNHYCSDRTEWAFEGWQAALSHHLPALVEIRGALIDCRDEMVVCARDGNSNVFDEEYSANQALAKLDAIIQEIKL